LIIGDIDLNRIRLAFGYQRLAVSVQPDWIYPLAST